MAEYIEREALREAFIKHFEAFYDDGKLVFSDHICTAEDCEDILKMVAELPTVDVVPVVRCKDCKHKETLTDSTNKKISTVCLLGEALHFVEDNHYCSYGERRCSNEQTTRNSG